MRSAKPTEVDLAPRCLELSPSRKWQFTAYAEVTQRVLAMAETNNISRIGQTLNRPWVPAPCAVMRQRRRSSSHATRKPQLEVRWSDANVQQNYFLPLLKPAGQERLLGNLRQRSNYAKGRTDQIRWVGTGITAGAALRAADGCPQMNPAAGDQASTCAGKGCPAGLAAGRPPIRPCRPSVRQYQPFIVHRSIVRPTSWVMS